MTATQVDAELLAREGLRQIDELLWKASGTSDRTVMGETLKAIERTVRAALASPTAGAASDGETVREALDLARQALRNYADPTGYTDNDGDPYEPDDEVHPGAMAKATLAKIDALLKGAAMPAPASSSDLGCQADRSPGDPANLAELMAAPASSSGVAGLAEDAWQRLCEVDDRTSPEEYPEMCLITFEELRDFMREAASSSDERAKVIEECAKVAENYGDWAAQYGLYSNQAVADATAREIADRIRALATDKGPSPVQVGGDLKEGEARHAHR